MKCLFNKRVAVRVIVCCMVVLLGERLVGEFFPYPLDLLGRYGKSRQVFSSDGRRIRVTSTMEEERLLYVPLQDVSQNMVNAVLAGEDSRFRNHSGVDALAVMRACVTSAWRGKVISGASTLTMQVARMAEPRPRNVFSKIIEMFRARQLERILSKDQILEAYLNLVPLGGMNRGVESASQTWFGKSSSDLTALEAAMFVAMLPAPSKRSPLKPESRLRYYRDQILRRMCEDEYLSQVQYDYSIRQPLSAEYHRWPFLAPHMTDWVLRRDDTTEIKTSIDLGLQFLIEDVVRQRTDKPVDGVAVVVVDRHTHNVIALLGSEDYLLRPFNAALANRPAGSTLKPFIYALALECGVIGMDGSVSDHPGSFGRYEPHNFSLDYLGTIRASEALSGSRNLPAIRLLDAVGIDRFAETLVDLGLKVPNRQLGLDAALGTLSVTPVALAKAYARCFDRKCLYVKPAMAQAVLDSLRSDDNKNLAWKTGTSSARRDAWCVGLTADHVVVVWLGNLNGRGHPSLIGSELAKPLLEEIVLVLTS